MNLCTLFTVSTGALLSFAGLAASADPGSCPMSGGHNKYEARVTVSHAGTIPEVAASAGNFKTLLAAVKAADLAETLSGKGPFTVFAPTDEAFAKLPKGTVENLLKPENKEKLRNILLYHVLTQKVEAATALTLTSAEAADGQRLDLKVKDGSLFVSGAKVTATDVAASNGVIHVIDTVMMPAQENLLGVAEHAGVFNTLIAAAKAAGLGGALTGKDALTVLAPTDEAFAKLPKGTVESLLKPENKDQLVKILKLHIIPGRVYSDQVVKLSSAKSIDGQTLTPVAKDGKVSINGAGVVKTDIQATNGVVHVIDTVLLPK